MSKPARKIRFRIPGLTIMSLLMVTGGTLRSAELISQALAETPTGAARGAAEHSSVDLLDAIKAREQEVAKREKALATRESALELSMSEAKHQLEALAEAEARLSKLVDHIDGAAQKDIEQLAAVYTAMKPKEVAALFSEMAPEFAAGFLASMPTDRAAAVLSEIEPKLAYSFSVLLAGRNAHLKHATN